jgi:cytochrome c2
MKKIGKWTAYVVITVILLVVISTSYIVLALPDVGKPEDVKIAITPERVRRGEYLATSVNLCFDCHSKHDWSKPIGPTTPENFGSGGDIFDIGDGFPGRVQAPNITPFNLKTWTDGELFRVLTTGVRKDGSAIFPMMPWQNYARMDREDIYAIIAYVRTINSIATPPYFKRSLNFPLGILVHTMPQKAQLGRLPSQTDTIAYGAYIINAAACNGCHSLRDHGKNIPGMEYAGGMAFQLGAITQYAANITPDKATGIGNWTSATFVAFFKSQSDSARKANPHAIRALIAMPVYDYSSMKVSDLQAIYAYLKSIKPVSNKISN